MMCLSNFRKVESFFFLIQVWKSKVSNLFIYNTLSCVSDMMGQNAIRLSSASSLNLCIKYLGKIIVTLV